MKQGLFLRDEDFHSLTSDVFQRLLLLLITRLNLEQRMVHVCQQGPRERDILPVTQCHDDARDVTPQ